ncbi:THAP domain [Popillia japonica]|uniref:THAP domain n=1 Tax=Popillia japonica TaxID=7064 RepID=A0AAW1M2R5_POPJA
MDLEETFNKWLQVIGNPAYLNKPKDYLYKNVMVCALHFKQDDFCMELNKGILKYGVIPSVNLKDWVRTTCVHLCHSVYIVQSSSVLQKCIASTKSMKCKATNRMKRIRKKLYRMSKEAITLIPCQMREW